MECHEEEIHRCGQIQSFGFLFVFNDVGCVAASDNITDLIGIGSTEVLGSSLEDVLNRLSSSVSWDMQEIEEQITGDIFVRFVERIQVDGIAYYVSIYRYDDSTYMEVEICNEDQLKATRLFYYAKYLEEKHDHVWQSLAVLIRQIIRFDRVMIYRFEEDNSGQVVAECHAADMTSLMGYRYPEFDIPAQARLLYKKFLARHVRDIDAPTVSISGTSKEDLDLTRCSLRALSPNHLQYLRNAGVRASASFSIIVEGRLWGLVACQNRIPRNVDLAQRHLCVFLTQYAVNFYLSEAQKQSLVAQSVLGAIERDLKAEILINSDPTLVFERFAQQIMEIVHADGLLVRHDRGYRTWGSVPSEKYLKQINRFFESNSDDLYVTSRFVYDDDHDPEETLFPGLVRIKILQSNKWEMYFFRQEHVFEEVWAGSPEKIFAEPAADHRTFPSPRTSFEAWREAVKGNSLKWKKTEIACLEKLAQITQQAIALRGGEIELLNNELIKANNALETFGYTLTHDLKNPLSAIKLAAQMIRLKSGLSTDMLHKLSANILDATTVITDMLDKVYELNRSSSVALKTERIDPRAKIMTILENCKHQFGVNDIDFRLGTTHPIRAEKTLLYQLFLNLIGNAVKYSSKEQHPRVEVYSEQKDNSIVYYVKDNGIGMDLEDGSNIFDIFQRLPNTTGYEGSGIGLSIVKRIVDRLGAKVDVESKLNEGTTFLLEFEDVV